MTAYVGKLLFFAIVILSLFLQLGCNKKKSDPAPAASASTTVVTKKYTVSWTASKETSVNSTGGGYKVYYSKTSGFGITDSGVSSVTVDSVTGTTTAATTTLSLTAGTWYVKVVGFNIQGAVSTPSDQITITVN